ncbi:hypothetical protein F66182_7279 [Fusarium sp. NRRL 66182]|nr:hypothetical protein F66182_7279 [Fusarium sp. NRRL 66182]
MPRTPASSASISNRQGREGRGWRGHSAGSSSGAGSFQQRARARPPDSNHHAIDFSPRSPSSIHLSSASRYQTPSTPREDANVRSSSEPIQHEVVMAIDMKDNATIGCSYFSTSDAVLYVSEDISTASLGIAEQFFLHVEPTSVLVSARAPEEFREHLDKFATSVSFSEDASGGVIFRGLQSSEFSTETARERLIGLQSHALSPTGIVFSAVIGDKPAEESMPGLTQPESHAFRSLRYGGYINMNSQVSVGCAGALLGDLLRRRSTGFLPDGQVAGVLFRVLNIRMFSLSAYMFVSADALLSLQILQTELHPNSQAWGTYPNKGNSKESLSVYGLFHHLASTSQGRAQLRQIFLRPLLDMDVISERRKSIEVLLQPDNVDKLSQLTSILRKIRNLRTTFAQLRKGIEFPSAGQSFDKGVWATIQKFTVQALALRETLGSLNGGAELILFNKLIESLEPASLVVVSEMVNQTIDFEQSKARNRSSVRTGIDPQLDQLKRRYDGMGSFLTEVVNHINRELPEWAHKYVRSCIFLPQIGFLTVVELNPATGNGQYEGEGTGADAWEKLFATNGAVCYKNNYMRELDEEYGDMYCQIGDREVEIIHDLAVKVLEHEELLLSASDTCGEFDAVLALALGAEKYNWRAPQVVEASIIHIKDGRHPLQELVVPAFVPNSCHLVTGSLVEGQVEENSPQALVLTGPNHSGKSVYLKQTAIIVYLAHIGSFVPASQATIGLTQNILTCISPRESMSGGESAFARDMKQAALSTKTSTPRSLILIDEFGKGTNGDDGAGLLAALLDHYLSLGPDCPRMLAATHFHEIFESGYLEHRSGLCIAHMSTRLDWEASLVDEQVTYLFSLEYGHNTSSFGGRCAALNGVPSAVVDRAERISQLLAQNEDLSTVCAQLSQAEEERLQKAEMTARLFLSRSFADQDGVEYSEERDDSRSSIMHMLEDILSPDT